MSMSTAHQIFKDRPIAALAVICLSVFVVSVDATIVNVALPTLSRELDADTANCSGSSTPTPSSWPGCCCRPAVWATASADAGFLSGGLVAVRGHVRHCGTGELGGRPDRRRAPPWASARR